MDLDKQKFILDQGFSFCVCNFELRIIINVYRRPIIVIIRTYISTVFVIQIEISAFGCRISQCPLFTVINHNKGVRIRYS